MRNTHPDPATTVGLSLERNAPLLPRLVRHPSTAFLTPADPGAELRPRRSDPWAGVALLVAFLCVAGPAEAAWMVPHAPYRAKDFSLIKRDGWYHCFYIRRNTSAPYDSTERDFGHAVSRDLYLWTQLPPVLPARPDYWDNAKVWAPDIREVDGVYYMFYTGVTNQPGAYAYYQSIGLATSTDLMTWNRLDEPLLSCADVRWTYCNPLEFTGGEFRDAFVMPDVSGAGWLMYYTAQPSGAPGTYVAGMASSSGNLTEWVNREPLWITHSSGSGSSVVESPHVFRHGGLYYLMFTGNGGEPLRLATGPDPTGEAATWTYRGTIGAMLGQGTSEWFASEYFVDGTHEYLAFVNYDRVDIREIVWGTGWQFGIQQPSLFHVQSLTWDKSQAEDGEPVQLRIDAVNAFGRHVKLEAVEVDADGSEEVIPADQMGLPDSIPMAGPVTHYVWTARTWPDPEQPAPRAEIVFRLTDRTAASPPISVGPAAWSPPPIVPDDGRVSPPISVFGRTSPRVGFRALQRSPLGGMALLVDLAEPAPVLIQIFDLGGRRVRSLADRVLPAGATVIAWDGREQSGATVRPGVYFARLAGPGFERTVRVISTP
jgi:beta-fructofuranosidase